MREKTPAGDATSSVLVNLGWNASMAGPALNWTLLSTLGVLRMSNTCTGLHASHSCAVVPNCCCRPSHCHEASASQLPVHAGVPRGIYPLGLNTPPPGSHANLWQHVEDLANPQKFVPGKDWQASGMSMNVRACASGAVYLGNPKDVPVLR